jgi:hypothetical protein
MYAEDNPNGHKNMFSYTFAVSNFRDPFLIESVNLLTECKEFLWGRHLSQVGLLV